MAYSQAQKEAVKKYNSEKYEEITIRVKAGNKKVVGDYAKAHNKTVNTLINELLEEKIPDFESNMKAGDPKNLERFKPREETKD